MTALERHVADICQACGAGREIHVNFQTQKYTTNFPKACQTRAACEKELLGIAEVGKAAAA